MKVLVPCEIHPTKKNRGREAAQGGGGGGCHPLFVRFIYRKQKESGG